MTALHLFIHGRVQGVGYRAWLERQAMALGIDGWARNRADGRVEALLQAPDDRLAQLIEAAGRGPPGASVARIEQSPGTAEPGAGFRILPTL